jgi:hypothetical protein
VPLNTTFPLAASVAVTVPETGASASELVRGARQRERDKRTLSPSERAIRRVPRRQRDEARELFGVPEPD